jgi:hypothetical protein
MKTAPPELLEPYQRLRWARERKYRTKTAAAEAMGVPYPTYAGHENGTTKIPRDQGLRYARFFRIRVGWLMNNEGGPTGNSDDDPFQELLNELPPEDRRELFRFGEYLRDRGKS